MKVIGTIGSIKQNSNKLISTTYSDWSAVREGSFIKFEDDVHFYIVSHVEKKTYLKDFIVNDPSVIQVNENCGANINPEDSLYISYKEYEISTVNKIINAGINYKVGDRLNLAGGKASTNIRDNTLNTGIITVNRIGENGEILEISIADHGKYIESPPSITSLQGGGGQNATIEISYRLSDHRTFIERDVESVEFKSAETIIHLVYGLPNGIKEGKLSIEKWEITLTSNYTGITRINQPFQVLRDFTPNYKMPLIAQNAVNQELIYNHTIAILDRKIAELEKRIKELEK